MTLRPRRLAVRARRLVRDWRRWPFAASASTCLFVTRQGIEPCAQSLGARLGVHPTTLTET